MAHSAVQGNDKEKLAYVWYSFHLLEFVLDEHKHAWNVGFYVTMLLNMETNYAGLKTRLVEKGISVQG